jgi:hypothetical protein
MHEYEITMVAIENGGFGLDVRPPGSTGSTPFVRFTNWDEVIAFFESIGLADGLVKEMQDIGQGLEPGSAYHAKMFLPEEIEKCITCVHSGCAPVPLPLTNAAAA